MPHLTSFMSKHITPEAVKTQSHAVCELQHTPAPPEGCIWTILPKGSASKDISLYRAFDSKEVDKIVPVDHPNRVDSARMFAALHGHIIPTDFEIPERGKTALRHGLHGYVFPLKDRKTGKMMAVKLFKAPNTDDIDEVAAVVKDIVAEVEVMMRHKGSLHIWQAQGCCHLDVQVDTNLQYIMLGLVMEWADQGNLQEFMQSIPMKEPQERLRLLRTPSFNLYLLSLLVQLGSGLLELWAANTVHCDLKLLNILVGPELLAKLADFGLARYVSDLTDRGRGTVKKIAPENLCGGRGQVQKESDVHSLGVILAECSAYLFSQSKAKEIPSRIHSTPLWLPDSRVLPMMQLLAIKLQAPLLYRPQLDVVLETTVPKLQRLLQGMQELMPDYFRDVGASQPEMAGRARQAAAVSVLPLDGLGLRIDQQQLCPGHITELLQKMNAEGQLDGVVVVAAQLKARVFNALDSIHQGSSNSSIVDDMMAMQELLSWAAELRRSDNYNAVLRVQRKLERLHRGATRSGMGFSINSIPCGRSRRPLLAMLMEDEAGCSVLHHLLAARAHKELDKLLSALTQEARVELLSTYDKAGLLPFHWPFWLGHAGDTKHTQHTEDTEHTESTAGVLKRHMNNAGLSVDVMTQGTYLTAAHLCALSPDTASCAKLMPLLLEAGADVWAEDDVEYMCYPPVVYALYNTQRSPVLDVLVTRMLRSGNAHQDQVNIARLEALMKRIEEIDHTCPFRKRVHVIKGRLGL